MKPVILYPVGGGGMWLANLIHSLHSQEFSITPSRLNFHDDTWKKTNLVSVQHWSNNVGPTADPHTFDSFVSLKTQFISFVNAYVKRWLHYNEFTQLAPMEQFFRLTNDAKWRMGNDPVFNNLYLNCIKLDADHLFLTPVEFAGQLFNLLDQYKIAYVDNTDFVLQSIDNFKATCKPHDHYGNVQSLAWQAWCHALALEHNITVDINIQNNFDEFIQFVDHNNEQFKHITKEKFLIQV